MVKALLFSFILICLLTQSASAQDYPAADQKWVNQHTLMHTGRARGKSSDNEAARMRSEYKQVRKMEKRMKLESKITSRDTKKIYVRKEQISREAHSRRTKKNMFSQCLDHA